MQSWSCCALCDFLWYCNSVTVRRNHFSLLFQDFFDNYRWFCLHCFCTERSCWAVMICISYYMRWDSHAASLLLWDDLLNDDKHSWIRVFVWQLLNAVKWWFCTDSINYSTCWMSCNSYCQSVKVFSLIKFYCSVFAAEYTDYCWHRQSRFYNLIKSFVI